MPPCYLKWHGAERDAIEMPAAWLTTVVQRQPIDRLRQRAHEHEYTDEPALRVRAPTMRRLRWRWRLGRTKPAIPDSEQFSMRI